MKFKNVLVIENLNEVKNPDCETLYLVKDGENYWNYIYNNGWMELGKSQEKTLKDAVSELKENKQELLNYLENIKDFSGRITIKASEAESVQFFGNYISSKDFEFIKKYKGRKVLNTDYYQMTSYPPIDCVEIILEGDYEFLSTNNS